MVQTFWLQPVARLRLGAAAQQEPGVLHQPLFRRHRYDDVVAPEASDGEVFDVIVVGAGPAGSSAALAAAREGARTLILDRAEFPRYKTCGGGLIGATLGSLPAGFEVPVRQEVFAATFSHRGTAVATKRSPTRVLSLVDRADFDDALLAAAVKAGALARFGVTVTSLSQNQHGGVTVATSAGPMRARQVVGADGSASRVARHVGVELAQVDLGLEVELDAAGLADDWAGRIHLDWGPLPGAYAWVFPKGERLTVGVIARKGSPVETRTYLDGFIDQLGLRQARVVRDSGHLTRCRTPGSPLGRGAVLVCGDAAGLLEPWTREGISFAVRSGLLAGEVAARAAIGTGPADVVGEYAARIEATLAVEMRTGQLLLATYERHPRLMHLLVSRTAIGWRCFVRITSGDASFTRIMRRPVARLAIRLLAGGPGA